MPAWIISIIDATGKWLVTGIAVIIYGWLCYWLGEKDAKIEYITREVEVVRYEAKCEIQAMSKVMAKPNLNDNNIIKLYETGGL